jgi:hypothetical protein
VFFRAVFTERRELRKRTLGTFCGGPKFYLIKSQISASCETGRFHMRKAQNTAKYANVLFNFLFTDSEMRKRTESNFQAEIRMRNFPMKIDARILLFGGNGQSVFAHFVLLFFHRKILKTDRRSGAVAEI